MFVMTVKIQLSNVQGQEKVFTLVEHHVKIHTAGKNIRTRRSMTSTELGFNK